MTLSIVREEYVQFIINKCLTYYCFMLFLVYVMSSLHSVFQQIIGITFTCQAITTIVQSTEYTALGWFQSLSVCLLLLKF